MKKDEKQKLKSKPVAELEKDLSESREKFGALSFDLASGKVKKTSEIRELKKRMARIFTFLREKTNQS